MMYELYLINFTLHQKVYSGISFQIKQNEKQSLLCFVYQLCSNAHPKVSSEISILIKYTRIQTASKIVKIEISFPNLYNCCKNISSTLREILLKVTFTI